MMSELVPFAGTDEFDTMPLVDAVKDEIEKALAAKAPPTVIAQLCYVAAKMIKDAEISAVRSNKMVHVSKAQEMFAEFAKLVHHEFSDVPDYEARFDRIVSQLKPPENTKRQRMELIGRER
jgi:hypothetical protein